MNNMTGLPSKQVSRSLSYNQLQEMSQQRNMSIPTGHSVQYNGLKNQGATCYLNAVLQCLFMTPKFRETVVSYEGPQGDFVEDSVLLQLKQLFKQLSGKAATTEGITKSLGVRNVFEQQDAVEYYRKILKAVKTHATPFEGKMSHVTKCCKCSDETKETNPFISILLSIDVGNDEAYDVENGLKAFFKHSKLEEDDWMYCENCDQKTETETWSKIDGYPSVLTLHLKRFDFDYIQMRYKKNECHLDVPLSLHPSTSNEDNWPKYDLYAVINHKGGYTGGHYEAIIRSYENGIWYHFDDRTVTQTSEASLRNSSLPYMLMYRKIKAVPHPLRILLIGPSRSGKSTVGNIILGGNYFACESGSETVTIESMAKTVGNVTVVDTSNLFSLEESSWRKEMERCIELCDPGPNVILWVTPISKFSDQQQALFHAFRKRVDLGTTKHMMIIFTNGRELENLQENIETFIRKRSKLGKVVHSCQDRYHVIDINDGHNHTPELLKKLSGMVTSGCSANSKRQLKHYTRNPKRVKAEEIKRLESD